eukprot:13396418-Alexandrium_andersonii.AAC.1
MFNGPLSGGPLEKPPFETKYVFSGLPGARIPISPESARTVRRNGPVEGSGEPEFTELHWFVE